MAPTSPDEFRALARIQAGVISRQQAIDCGMSSRGIDRVLISGRWQSLRRGVYLTHSGAPSRRAILWAAVHSAGSGAVLSHQTAAELSKLIDRPTPLIHVTIPGDRRVKTGSGIVVHRSVRLAVATHPALTPPQTRIEETVLDLADQARDFEAAFNVACAACQRRITTADRILAAMNRRSRLRWRAELTEALGHVGAGVHSLLEYRYVRLVERPHRLPAATRQAWVSAGQRARYLDNLYPDYGLCVELDGLQAHPDDQRWHDLRRINAITEEGITVLRYGWTDINSRPCQTAAQIAAVLGQLGWGGTLSRCSAKCTTPLHVSDSSGH